MNQRNSFGAESSNDKNRKTSFGPQIHHPHQQAKSNPVKDIKEKRKLVSHSEVHAKKTSANPRNLKTSLNESQKKLNSLIQNKKIIKSRFLTSKEKMKPL